jgi:hypothetical protein
MTRGTRERISTAPPDDGSKPKRGLVEPNIDRAEDNQYPATASPARVNG